MNFLNASTFRLDRQFTDFFIDSVLAAFSYLNDFLNDTRLSLEELVQYKNFIEIQGWLLLTLFSQVLLILLSYRCLKSMIHQVGSKSELNGGFF